MNHLERLLARLKNVSGGGRGYLACCPAHNDSRPSLSVELQPGRRVRLRCRSAGCSTTAILQALGLLFEDLMPDPGDDLVADDCHLIGEIDDSAVEPSIEVAPDLEQRDRVYRAWLERLQLTNDHRSNLRSRGLNDNEIDQNGYNSLAFFTGCKAVEAVRQRFPDAELENIPGLKRDSSGTLAIVSHARGLLIPVRDPRGRITALCCRRDVVHQDETKYTWLSGAGSSSCGAPVHVPLGTPTGCPACRVTEGQLKADVAFARSGLPTLGVAGVDLWPSAIPILEELGVERVHIAFDADLTIKPHVAAAALALATQLSTMGKEVVVETWSIDDGKGIDDLLAGGKTPELLIGEDGLSFLRRHAAADGLCGDDGGNSTHTTNDACHRHARIDEDNDSVGTGHSLPAAPQPANPMTEQSVPVFPLEIFPAELQRYARSCSEAIGCPVDLIGVPMIAVASTAIGNSRRLVPKPGWGESPRFYFAVVAPPGSSKSPAQSTVSQPLIAAQRRYWAEYKAAKIAYERAQEEQKSRTRGRSTAGSSSDMNAEAAEQNSRRANPAPAAAVTSAPACEEPFKPVPRRVLVNDATVEGLAPILAQNPRGILATKDELVSLVRGLGQYKGGRGSDRQFYLSAWSGEMAVVDRKTQAEPIMIPNPFVNILGGIQPDLLGTLQDEKGRADGFMDRFLIAFPVCEIAQEWTEQGVDQELAASWQRTINQLLQLQMLHDEVEDVDRPRLVQFTPAGRQRFIDWYTDHQREARAAVFDLSLAGAWSKMRTHAVRLILTIHMLRLIHGEAASEDVDDESVRRGLLLTEYFKAHAKKVYRHLQTDSVDESRAQRALSWIRRSSGECTARQLHNANVAGINKTSKANELMKELADRGFGELTSRTAPNGKQVTWLVLFESHR